ncbi:hypothetical protein FDX20_27015, partial [Citrobacter sp. TBCS-11]
MIFLKEGGNILKDTTSQSGKEHKPRLIQHANGPSLEEINGTVEVPKGKGFWKTLFAYSGLIGCSTPNSACRRLA